ncbi:MAG: hypothetical protein BWY69_00901 [Planctomycetes bacterium ADurb.Bin401]|nr:MAG: hypothetical protein BWY69_00901 [Planctomycetes bacterium ADurb.Bin401]
MKYIKLAVIFVLFFVSSLHAVTQSKVQQVALFKNGLGFFISQLECPDQKVFAVEQMPAPSLGTFWVSYPQNAKLETIVAKDVFSEKPTQAISIPELLQANIGQEVILFLEGKEDSPIQGVISYFAENREPPKNIAYPRYEAYNPFPPVQPAALMIVQTETGEMALNPAQVRQVKFTGSDIKRDFGKKEKAVQLEFTMAQNSPGEQLTLSYLAKGITWTPSYIIDITDPDKASISAKAMIVNEICDLNNVTLQLITGYPNLKFADIISPIAKKETLQQFIQALGRDEKESIMRGALAGNMMQNTAMYEMKSDLAKPVDYGTIQQGAIAEDLFLYPRENINIAKGQVAYLPLFTESVDYNHIYEWKIPDYVNADERYYYDNRQQKAEPVETVWHCLRLENSTKIPWTTASAEITKDGFIIGQDILNYTPSTTKTTLKITQAANIKAEQLELETARKLDASQLYGNHYDLVTITGKLSIANHQEKAVTVEITKTISGDVQSSEPNAAIKSLARGLNRMNPVRNLTWTIELAPGESKQLDYVYDVYVRR